MSYSLEHLTLYQAPFPCFTSKDVLSPDEQGLALSWLESDAPWQLVVETFYEQYEFSLSRSPPPAFCSFLVDDAQIAAIRSCLETAFGCRLRPTPDVTAHKLLENQTIRVHNDFLEDGERCRFIVQFNRSWTFANGGILMAFPAEDQNPSILVPPISGSAFGFRISQKSHHAVSTVHGGERYTIVYSFYDEP
jgi:hypothetical protein